MALWNGAAINSNETAMVFNQLYNRKALSMVRKKNALLYAILGKEETGSNPNGEVKFKRLTKISGHNIEVKLRGKTYANLATVADGSGEYATYTPEYISDVFGANEFALTHYTHQVAIPSHEINRFKGEEAKTLSYIGDVFETIMLTYEKELGTQINSTNNASRTQLSGWPWAASDGASSGETGNAVYGLLDRSDAGNVDYRGYNIVGQGALTLKAIRQVINNVQINGGNPDTGICAATVYGIIQMLLEGYTIVTDVKALDEYGSKFFRYAGVDFMLDKYAPANVLGLLDSSTWMFYMNKMGLSTDGIIPAPWFVSTHIINYEFYCGMFCELPSHNGKIAGITS